MTAWPAVAAPAWRPRVRRRAVSAPGSRFPAARAQFAAGLARTVRWLRRSGADVPLRRCAAAPRARAPARPRRRRGSAPARRARRGRARRAARAARAARAGRARGASGVPDPEHPVGRGEAVGEDEGPLLGQVQRRLVLVTAVVQRPQAARKLVAGQDGLQRGAGTSPGRNSRGPSARRPYQRTNRSRSRTWSGLRITTASGARASRRSHRAALEPGGGASGSRQDAHAAGVHGEGAHLGLPVVAGRPVEVGLAPQPQPVCHVAQLDVHVGDRTSGPPVGSGADPRARRRTNVPCLQEGARSSRPRPSRPCTRRGSAVGRCGPSVRYFPTASQNRRVSASCS
jgi:hypothetical protein